MDRHGKRGARAYNGGLGAERPPLPPPVKTRRMISILGATSSKSGVDMSTPVHVHPVATTLRICRRRAPCCGTVAARRRRLLDRYLSLPERQQQQTRRTPLLQSIGETGGQTDGRTLDRLIDSACSAYHACSDNTYKRRIPYVSQITYIPHVYTPYAQL